MRRRQKKSIFRNIILGINLALLAVLLAGIYIGDGYQYASQTWRDVLDGKTYLETTDFQSLASDAVYDSIGAASRISRMESGGTYDPDRVIWFHTEDRKTKPGLMTRLLLEQGLPVDGIVCYNDQIAVSVVHVLREMGKNVPEDISITGYDNSVMAGEDVSLTTIVHPQEKLGEMAAELLLEKIREVPEEKSQIPRLIQPELILRNSVKDRRKKEEN